MTKRPQSPIKMPFPGEDIDEIVAIKNAVMAAIPHPSKASNIIIALSEIIKYVAVLIAEYNRKAV